MILALSISLAFADHHEEKPAAKTETKEVKDPKAEARKTMFEASKKMFIEIKKKQMARHQAAVECAEKAEDQDALKKCREESRVARDELKSTNKTNKETMQNLRKSMRERLRNKKREKNKAQ